MDCSLPGSSIHGIFQARVLEWAAIAFSKTDKKWGIYIKVRLYKMLTNYKKEKGKRITSQQGRLAGAI